MGGQWWVTAITPNGFTELQASDLSQLTYGENLNDLSKKSQKY